MPPFNGIAIGGSVKVHFHKMTTEYSSGLVDKIADKEADMVAMRK